MADELKALPTSRVAEALRRYQETAASAASDPARAPFVRGVATVADALIGKAPEGLDDFASGMARLKRPSAQQSWVGANEAVLDAASLAPTSGASKAAFMGPRMLRIVGREDEFYEAADILRKTGTPPPGWFVHPGSPKGYPRLAKYEPQKFDRDALRELDYGLEDGRLVDLDASNVLVDSDYVKAYNRLTPQKGGRLTVTADPDKTKNSYGTYQPKQDRIVLRPGLVKRGYQLPTSPQLALRETLGHEMSHGAAAVEEYPDLMRGANVKLYDPSPTMKDYAASWAPQASPAMPRILKGGKSAPDISGLSPAEAVRAILEARYAAMEARGPRLKQYRGNPGESGARAIERVEVRRALEDPSPGVLNRILAQEMEKAHVESTGYPNLATIDDDVRGLYNLFEAQKRRSSMKGPP